MGLFVAEWYQPLFFEEFVNLGFGKKTFMAEKFLAEVVQKNLGRDYPDGILLAVMALFVTPDIIK